LANGDYYWRARAVDNLGMVSAWTSFGTNSDNTLLTIPADTDFTVDTSGGIIPGPGGSSGGGGGGGGGCGAIGLEFLLMLGLLKLGLRRGRRK
jgi:hypothetical protein